MAETQHRIVDVDRAALTGVCARCGPVEIRIRIARRARRKPREVIECRAAVRARQTSGPSGPSGKNRTRTFEQSWATRDDYRDNRPGRLPLTRREARERLAGAVCELCSAAATVNDHEHASNIVRGTLCRDCNLLLGYAHDDPERLRSAAAYLERYRA